MLEEALQASVVRIEVGGVWESGGELGQIDGFDLEQSDDDGGQAGDASTVQGTAIPASPATPCLKRHSGVLRKSSS